MSSDNFFNFTAENFQKKVLEANRPVFVLFWTVWADPCRAILPFVEQLADNYVDKLKVGGIDVECNQSIAITHGVASIPTCLLFKSGVVVMKLAGAVPYARLEVLVKPYI